MSTPIPPTQERPPLAMRRRTVIACANCRRRKVRCITMEQPPSTPCVRCRKRQLPCEYVTIRDSEGDSPSAPGEGSDTDSPTSPRRMDWAPALTPGNFPPGHGAPPALSSAHPSTSSGSSSSITPGIRGSFRPPATRPRSSVPLHNPPQFGSIQPAFHHPRPAPTHPSMNSGHYLSGSNFSPAYPSSQTPSFYGSSPNPADHGPAYNQTYRPDRPSTASMAHNEYQLQGARAHDYLTTRQLPAQPYPPSAWPSMAPDASADYSFDPRYDDTRAGVEGNMVIVLERPTLEAASYPSSDALTGHLGTELKPIDPCFIWLRFRRHIVKYITAHEKKTFGWENLHPTESSCAAGYREFAKRIAALTAEYDRWHEVVEICALVEKDPSGFERQETGILGSKTPSERTALGAVVRSAVLVLLSLQLQWSPG
ncbi:hypothetical protein FB451DRAFT_1164851 [Mycena latifolia]|nr:hypothetical protein FB451DRAFT_1164851 [Mycena latifolia]